MFVEYDTELYYSDREEVDKAIFDIAKYLGFRKRETYLDALNDERENIFKRIKN